MFIQIYVEILVLETFKLTLHSGTSIAMMTMRKRSMNVVEIQIEDAAMLQEYTVASGILHCDICG